MHFLCADVPFKVGTNILGLSNYLGQCSHPFLPLPPLQFVKGVSQSCFETSHTHLRCHSQSSPSRWPLHLYSISLLFFSLLLHPSSILPCLQSNHFSRGSGLLHYPTQWHPSPPSLPLPLPPPPRVTFQLHCIF